MKASVVEARLRTKLRENFQVKKTENLCSFKLALLTTLQPTESSFLLVDFLL